MARRGEGEHHACIIGFNSGLFVPAEVKLTASGDINQRSWSGALNLSTDKFGSLPYTKIRCICKYKYKRTIRFKNTKVNKRTREIRIFLPDGAITTTKVVVLSGNEWAEIELLKSSKDDALKGVDQSSVCCREELNGNIRSHTCERQPLFCELAPICETGDPKEKAGTVVYAEQRNKSSAERNVKRDASDRKGASMDDRPIIAWQPHVNEEKENVKKAAVAPKRQIVNQNRVPSRRTAQHRGTYSLRKTPPMYVPAWRRNVRIDNNKNSLAKVGSSSLRDEVMKESVKDTSKASSRKLPISQNSAAHAKRAGLVCNVARIPARKKSLSGKKDFSANALPLNRSQNTSSKADLMEKPKRQCQSELSKTFAKSAFKLCKSHTESILDQSSPKTRIYYAGTISGAPLVESGSCGATVSFNPNVNSDFCRWTTSCAALIKTATPRGITPGISTARFRTKAAGCTTEKATPTDAGLNSQMDPQLITLSSDGKFVNDAPLESPLITADDEKHDSISEKFDQNTYDYYVPKIIADYLEGSGYTQMFAATINDGSAMCKRISFVETLRKLVYPTVVEEVETYQNLYCNAREKGTLIENVIRKFNERVCNLQRWKSLQEKNEVQC